VAEPPAAAGERLRPVVQERAFARLPAGPIDPERIEAVALAVAGQAAAARALGAGRVRVVATAAVREAPNGAELCARVGERAGVEVEVLGGDEEARLAFAGATCGIGPGDGPVGVADVGGGSTELVCGTPGGAPDWWTSLAIGSGRVTEAHLPSDPPTAGELAAAREAVGRVFAGVAAPAARGAFAVGGSATSVRRIVGAELSPAALGVALARIVRLPAAEAARRLDLHPERARLLPAGILLLEHAARALGGRLEIAAGGLREGVLMEEFRHGQGR